uniref:Uncharacterized protein n=1 Tax=Rhizophora mucronata TaxID=61149 RepID=A0A2P2Q1S2_RHIMU
MMLFCHLNSLAQFFFLFFHLLYLACL